MTNRRKNRGQNLTEYMILVVGVVTVVILAIMPGGFFTKGVDKSLNLMLSGVDKISAVPCLGTLDNDNGGWSDYGSWGPCSSCMQIRTRTCTNPAPKCSGKKCVLDDGVTQALLQTQTQACTSGNWVVGACGVCTGNCGSSAGTCTQSVVCNGGCCDPATQPASVISCIKPAYLDVWSALGFGACSVSCGVGVANQTVTCSGSCCNAAIKPPTTKSCIAGCCQMTEPDITSNGAGIPGTFPNTPDGSSATVACPSGYAGNPAKACSGTTWGPLTGLCDPDNCPAYPTTVAGVTVTLPGPTASGSPQVSVSCSSFDNRYDGTVFGDCNAGVWTVTGSCAPKSCSAEIFSDPNGFISGTFPASPHGTTQTLTCANIDSKYTGTFSRTCDYGVWINPTGGCAPPSCPDWTTKDPNGFVNVTFTAAPNGTPQTVHCKDFDSNYTGDVGATCNAGTWGSISGCCNLASPCPLLDNIDVGGPAKACLPATPNGQSAVLLKAGCSSGGFSCPSVGYTTSAGSSAVTCRNGVWDPVPTRCWACPVCPAASRGVTAGTINLLASLCGQSQSVSCPPPATYTGTDTYYCQSDGTWIRTGWCSAASCTAPTCNSATECGAWTKPDSCGVNQPLNCGDCCTGLTPPGGTWSWCPGDSMAGTGTTKIAIVSVNQGSCTARQCEVQCNAGYVSNGTTCTWGASCASPCGNGTIAHNSTDTCYSVSSVPCGSLCSSVAKTATCNNGSWSVSGFSTTYTNKICTVQTCCGNGSCDDGNGGRPNYGESCSVCPADCAAFCTCPAGQIQQGTCGAGYYESGDCPAGQYEI